MRFDIVTLFAELFEPFMSKGVARRAFASPSRATTEPGAAPGGDASSPAQGEPALQVEFWNPRDFVTGNYRRVDDRPFGGGPGMVMLAEPLAACLRKIRLERADRAPVVLFSPGGRRLDDGGVRCWAQSQGAILICGRYEGVDQRFVDAHVDQQLSLGDFVLSGSEIAALALLDAVARLLPGVLNDSRSHEWDSFNPALDGLLDAPHFTRPEVWGDRGVPEVLLSGHHERIAKWRREQSLQATASMRPDLIEAARSAGRLTAQDEAFLTRPAS